MLYFGDCLEFMRGMVERGERVDAIVTDPPYLYLNHKLDRKFDEREFFELASKITDKIVFFGRGDSFYRWNLICAELGFEFKEEIIWDKKLMSNPFGVLGRQHETISVRCKKDTKLNKVYIPYKEHILNGFNFKKLFFDIKKISLLLNKPKLLKDYIQGTREYTNRRIKHSITCSMGAKDCNREMKSLDQAINGVVMKSIIECVREHYDMEHPTQKPIHLLINLINLVSNKSDTIFDPFMGSGSTGVASLIEGRKFIGCEIDKEYFEIAQKRITETDKELRQSLFYGI